MTDISTRAGIDPNLKALLDAVPLVFTIDDGVEVARERLRAVRPPAEMLPEMRIEERTIGHGDLADIPARIYWPPIEAHGRYAELLSAASVLIEHSNEPTMVHGYVGLALVSPVAAEATNRGLAALKAALHPGR